MSSASLVDYLAEKLYSYSSKMRGDSYQPSISSFLMNGSNSHFHDLPQLLGEFKENAFHGETAHPNSPFQPLFRPFRLLGGLRYFHDMDKPSYFSNYHSENWVFSPHLFSLVSESYRYRNSHIDSALISSAKMVLRSDSNQDKDTMLTNSSAPCHHSESEVFKAICDAPCQPSESEVIKAVSDPPASEKTKMLVDITHSPTAKNVSAEVKCDISHSLRLNLELTQRKTKEMNKRSKKRRRRQKKNEQVSVSSSTSTSDDDADSELQSSVTSSVFLSENPTFECTLSVTHTVQMSPCKSSFLIPVESNSDDDTDWETIDIEELSSNSIASSGSERTSDGLSSSDSSPVKSERSDSASSSPIKCTFQVSRSLMSFVAPESDSDDDDNSDWDSCETAVFTEDAEFEFTGLFLTNLCVPQTLTSQSDFDSYTPQQECNEIVKLRADLLEANKKWNEFSEKSAKPKSASKVTFASEENLVEVFPVEVFERKGEWETYATERLRFKRRIDELEKVLSPCLNPEHRTQIFKTVIEPNL